jgi:hypothetical protein
MTPKKHNLSELTYFKEEKSIKVRFYKDGCNDSDSNVLMFDKHNIKDIEQAPNLLTKVIRKILMLNRFTYQDFYNNIVKFVEKTYSVPDKLLINSLYSNYIQHIIDNVYGIISWTTFITILDIIYSTDFTKDNVLNDTFDNSLTDILVEKIEKIYKK